MVAEMLLKRIGEAQHGSPQPEPRSVRLEGRLVIRESTAEPPVPAMRAVR
jgi:DNA-binding LacI/PurR family transcriptional regulator